MSEEAAAAHPAIEAARTLIEACLAGCGAQVGPLIGVEPEPGEVEVDVEEGPPEGELVVMPLSVQRGGAVLGSIEVVSPLDELVSLARRVNGGDAADKQEISDVDRDAIGEMLKLFTAAVEAALQQALDPELGAVAADWWRSDDPGDASFAESECLIGAGALEVPGGSTTNLFFRCSTRLFQPEAAHADVATEGVVLLVELDETLQSAFSQALGAQIETVSTEDEDFEARCARASTLVLSKDLDGCLERCRQLRLAGATWRLPIVLCAAEPEREWVLRALDEGASHVLCTPAEPAAIQRVLEEAELRA